MVGYIDINHKTINYQNDISKYIKKILKLNIKSMGVSPFTYIFRQQ
jgi:hypothetical protein